MNPKASFFSALVFSTLLALPAAADSSAVELTATDGVRLAATYTSPGKPGPGVLLLHMCDSDRSAWTGVAEKLAARGIHSLALDYRGYGESDGQRGGRARRLWTGDIDVAYHFLGSQPGVDRARLAAGGGDCGVGNAVQLARRHPGEVKTLVLLADSSDLKGEAFLAENPWLPIFAAASRDDGHAFELTRWEIGFSSHPGNRFLEFEHGGHGTEMFAAHTDLEPAIADWYVEHLVTNPVTKPDAVVAKPGPSMRIWKDLLAPGGPSRLLAAEGGNLPPEIAVNEEAYHRLSAGRIQEAIEILAFGVEAYPKSSNALDSLGDAYLAAGEAEKAAEYALRAIDAIPSDPYINETIGNAIRRSAEGKLATSGL